MRRTGIALAALVFTATACTRQESPDSGIASAGGPNPETTGTSAPRGTYDGVKLAQCLREQGIPAEDPPSAEEKPRIPESVDEQQTDAATQKCKQFAPDYGKPPPPLDPAQLELLRKFATCMREQGVQWEDPGPDGRPKPAPPAARDGGKVREDGQKMLDAARVCGEKVPGTGITVSGVDGDGTKEEPK